MLEIQTAEGDQTVSLGGNVIHFLVLSYGGEFIEVELVGCPSDLLDIFSAFEQGIQLGFGSEFTIDDKIAFVLALID